MAIINFPPNPNPGDRFTAPNGFTYEFKNPPGAWVIYYAPSSLPSGSTMIFLQPAAPTGWTQVTTAGFSDSMIKLITGSGGATTGGSIPFSTFFTTSSAYNGTLTLTSGQTGDFTLSEQTMAAHSHFFPSIVAGNGSGRMMGGNCCNGPGNINSSFTGGGQSHNHTLVGATADGNFVTDFSLKYVDAIVASRN
jgi:hypothetical protein